VAVWARELSNALRRHITWKITIVAFLFVAPLGAMEFSMIDAIEQQAASGRASSSSSSSSVLLLDKRLYYTPRDVYDFFGDLGEQGRASYLRFYVHGQDVVAPVALCVFMTGLVSFLFPAYDGRSVIGHILACTNVVTVLSFVLDMIENSCFVALLHMYPSGYPSAAFSIVARVGGVCSTVKHLCIFASTALVVVGACVRLYSSVRAAAAVEPKEAATTERQKRA